MKFLPLLVLSASLLASFIFWGGGTSGLIFFVLWVAAPVIFSIVASILNLKKIYFTRAIPVTGAVVAALALLPYYESYSYDGTDGQAGLIFAVMPVYQLIIIGIASAISYITRRSNKDAA